MTELSEAQTKCTRCKKDYSDDRLELLIIGDGDVCQSCEAELSGKYADWAWENEEVVLITPMRLIEKIAVHREGNIKQAMLYIAEDMWAMAKLSIEAEIARLESE